MRPGPLETGLELRLGVRNWNGLAGGFWVGRDEVNGGALRRKAPRSVHRTAPNKTKQPDKPDHHSQAVCHAARTICPPVNVKRLRWKRKR